MKETDLYQPLKDFLVNQGYEVKSEIKGCDVVAIRNAEEAVIIELKLALNIAVVLQAVERLSMTSKVYIGVPKQTPLLKSQGKRVNKLLRMLGVGLITIETSNSRDNVEVLIDPSDYQPRKSKFRSERLLGEFAKRVGDPNRGGSETKKGILTAYRQRALAIAGFIQSQGPSKASVVAQALKDDKARDLLYRNVYGWFDRIAVGIYDVSPRGRKAITLWNSKER